MNKFFLKLKYPGVLTLKKNFFDFDTSINLRKLIGNKRFFSKSIVYHQTDTKKMDPLKSNPFFSKYESKLKAVYSENPEAFQDMLKNFKPEKIGNETDLGVADSKMAHSLTKKRSLDSMMKTELLKDLNVEEIKSIWTTYLKEKSRLADILTKEEYETIIKRSQEYKTFLFPLPKNEGYEFILAQWANNECHFTPLINFQAHGENAPSIMTLVLFDELIQSKAVVLEMAEIDTKHLKIEEANLLCYLLKSYYLRSNENDEKYALLNCFTKTPQLFKYMDLIKQLENDNLKLELFKIEKEDNSNKISTNSDNKKEDNLK